MKRLQYRKNLKLRVSVVHCFHDYIELSLSYSVWMNRIDCGILAPVIKALTVAYAIKTAPPKRKDIHMRHEPVLSVV